MEELHQSSLLESGGVRVAVQGCGHGHLDSIYQSVQSAAESRGWDGVDLLIIGGDFQAVRNAADLTVMSVPIKYRKLGDFPEYYSGRTKAPFLTIFIGGNHEASSHSWELYYGGWVAPNIYYLGFANVLRFGPIRIAGMSGIWNDPDYNKPHIERLPFNHSNHSNHNDIKSFYHVREFDVRKLLLIREQVDIGLSHDWPKGIERYGDEEALWRIKPFFKRGSLDGTLGSPAATYVLDRLRPLYWFSAHMHCTFSAVKRYEGIAPASPSSEQKPRPVSTEPLSVARPAVSPDIPGQPVPTTIFNTETRFLALDKCGPGKKHLKLCYMRPAIATVKPASTKFKLEYDPEWLAITRVFHQYLTIGERDAETPANEGEDVYTEMIDKERRWVNEHIVAQDKLTVPENFTLTAPPHNPGDPETVNSQPREYTNPQTVAFCELVQIKNLWDATSQERNHRKAQGPHRGPQPRSGNRGGRGRGKDGDRGGGHGGRGRDRSSDRS